MPIFYIIAGSLIAISYTIAGVYGYKQSKKLPKK